MEKTDIFTMHLMTFTGECKSNIQIFIVVIKDSCNENNYTLKKGKNCNEKSFSYHAYTNAGLSFQV